MVIRLKKSEVNNKLLKHSSNAAQIVKAWWRLLADGEKEANLGAFPETSKTKWTVISISPSLCHFRLVGNTAFTLNHKTT